VNVIDPFYFGGAEEPLFGVLDPAERPGSRGVLICAPIGYENVIYHRQLAILARRLATGGRPVLRFDWPGAGDSYGDDDTDDLIARSVASVAAAADALVARTGVEVVDVVGLRFGATLAAAAVADCPSAGDLVLWDPFPTGRSYVRAVRAFERLSLGVAGGEHEQGQSASGFYLSPSTLTDIEALDLRERELGPARRVLLAGRDGPPSEALAKRFEELGHDVTTTVFEGLREVALGWTERPVPIRSFEAIEEWLAEPEGAARAEVAEPSQPRRCSSPAGWSEEPVLLVDGSPMLGIATVPDALRPDAPWLLFVPNRYARRIGPNALYRRWARAWAAEGLPSLRIDVNGTGDAGGPDEETDRDMYRQDGVADVRRALAFLRERYGAKGAAVVGLCSGGYLGFQAALDDELIRDVVLLNPQMLLWTDQETAVTRASILWRRAGSLESWSRLVRTPRTLAQTVLPVVGEALMAGARWRLSRGSGALGVGKEPPVAAWIRLAIAKLEARGCRLHFVFSEDDAGIGYLTRHLGSELKGLVDRPHVSLTIVPDADHTFRDFGRQRALRELLEATLRGRGYLRAVPSEHAAVARAG
jgi:pimeloyl-ACP methyl ester carboxylesterase